MSVRDNVSVRDIVEFLPCKQENFGFYLLSSHLPIKKLYISLKVASVVVVDSFSKILTVWKIFLSGKTVNYHSYLMHWITFVKLGCDG